MQSQNIARHRYSLSQNTHKDVEFDLIPRTKSTIVDLNCNILSQASFDFLQLSNLQLNEEFEESTPDGRQVNPEKLDLKNPPSRSCGEIQLSFQINQSQR